MKVSKLFHWLYGALMLLPLFAIVSKVLYVAFNKNAKESYYGETINEKIYTSVSDFKLNEQYDFISNFQSTQLVDTSINSGYRLEINVNNVITNSPNLNFNELKYISFYRPINATTLYFYGYDSNNSVLFQTIDLIQNQIHFEFTYIAGALQPVLLSGTQLFTQIEYNKDSYIDNVFYYSVNQLNNEPLFSWASDSFLSQPITYISNLFGMPSDSPILTMLSYWLDISIIWLTFDLIMYVPLLVHRWLDKGILE